jgi:hypothetical protein
LGNPIHDRAHPEALAVLCMTRATNRTLLRDLQISPTDQPGYHELVVKVASLESTTRKGTPTERLAAELALRRFLATDPRVPPLRAAAKRVADRPRISVWAEHFRRHERVPTGPDLEPLMDALVARGAFPVAISEGLRRYQNEKLERTGLLERFRGCTLLTETAAAVPGRSEFDLAFTDLINRQAASGGDIDPELTFLWHYHGIIEAWSSKTPWFFGRCLHALQESPTRPEEVFREPRFVEPDRWRKQPLRFVMIGDRYDKDVEPLIDLLGPNIGLKLRLRMGKYGHRHPEDALLDHRRADRTSMDWDSLTRFLTEETTVKQIPPIIRPPDIADRGQVVTEHIERGLNHCLEAVRVVAEVVDAMGHSNP